VKNSKKLFLILAAIFLAAMLYIGYDISSRTTFPGSKPQLKERLLNSDESKQVEKDTVSADTLQQQK